jgi:hypothetical protein
MTGEEIADALLKHAKEIVPEATVIVFATSSPEDDDESLAMTNASPYDLTTVVHMATDWLLEDMSELLDKVAAKPPAERPS